MAEVESLLNSRPITPVSSDPLDYEALTPNHFLLGRASVNIPVGVMTDRDLFSRKQWKHSQVMANHFWSAGFMSMFLRLQREADGIEMYQTLLTEIWYSLLMATHHVDGGLWVVW